jgi:predicted nucleic acid-binding Zn ribbon protein
LLQQRQPPGPIPNGLCHWCGELVSDEARWCDAGCRESWDKARRAIVRNGRWL